MQDDRFLDDGAASQAGDSANWLADESAVESRISPIDVPSSSTPPICPGASEPDALEKPYRLTLRRIKRPEVSLLESSRNTAHSVSAENDDTTDSAEGLPTQRRKKKSRRSLRQDPLTQSLMLLATMSVLLLAARFVVPRVAEEVRYAWHRGELRAEYESGSEGLRNVSLDALSEAYQMVTGVVGPSVVHIDVQRRMPISTNGDRNNISSHFLPSSDQGSGVVVDAEGYLLTNRHVIADGEDITVTLSDGRRVQALVVGTDALTDLAVLKINCDRLIPIQWGDSDRCKVGSPVWAVGSPFGLDRTITFGILSGKHRMVRASTQYQDFMQSDVAVNPGNSGGPLVDARGTLVGINTAIVGDTYQGVSFSVPSNVARQIYTHLRETGRVQRGWLGVALGEVPDDLVPGDDQRVRGALVSGMTDDQSPAAFAGLKTGDLILTVSGTNVRDMGHLMRLIGEASAGQRIKLGIRRGDSDLGLEVVLGARPESIEVQ